MKPAKLKYVPWLGGIAYFNRQPQSKCNWAVKSTIDTISVSRKSFTPLLFIMTFQTVQVVSFSAPSRNFYNEKVLLCKLHDVLLNIRSVPRCIYLCLQAGVSKLNEAKALVDDLKRRAAEQSALLKTKQQEADAALQEITISMQVCVCASFLLVRACMFVIISGRQDCPSAGSHTSTNFPLRFYFILFRTFFRLFLLQWIHLLFGVWAQIYNDLFCDFSATIFYLLIPLFVAFYCLSWGQMEYKDWWMCSLVFFFSFFTLWGVCFELDGIRRKIKKQKMTVSGDYLQRDN